MFADPLAISYDSVTKNQNLIKFDNRTSEYYLDDGSMKFTTSIKHVVPTDGAYGESHLVRLDIKYYDGNGVYLRKVGVWLSTKTYDGEQVTTDSDDAVTAFIALMTSGNITKLLGRQV
jgi:hypothetical protein